jgi:two-component system osmolarity sensor histidine kinase EnvZ
MVHDLQQVESDRAVILAGISHDLRTPIARMLLEVEMAGLSDEARRGMQSDLAQMEAIIAQFLDYARPAGTETHTEFDLSALLHKVATEAGRSPGIRVSAHIAEGLRIRGNPTEIERVLSNLVENARRYGKMLEGDATLLDISASKVEGQIVVELADRGPGLPEDQIPYLMRPFTRMDAARSGANGAGLGLAIVDRIVQRHHGRLEIANRDGGGLAVRMWLRAA